MVIRSPESSRVQNSVQASVSHLFYRYIRKDLPGPLVVMQECPLPATAGRHKVQRKIIDQIWTWWVLKLDPLQTHLLLRFLSHLICWLSDPDDKLPNSAVDHFSHNNNSPDSFIHICNGFHLSLPCDIITSQRRGRCYRNMHTWDRGRWSNLNCPGGAFDIDVRGG